MLKCLELDAVTYFKYSASDPNSADVKDCLSRTDFSRLGSGIVTWKLYPEKMNTPPSHPDMYPGHGTQVA